MITFPHRRIAVDKLDIAEVQERFNAVLESAAKGEPILVEVQGEPLVAIISVKQLAQMQGYVDRFEAALARFEVEKAEAGGHPLNPALESSIEYADFDEAIVAADRDREIHQGTFRQLAK
jgi:prevent-host-death family protein